jgi:cellulose synthase (UDP-forming)
VGFVSGTVVRQMGQSLAVQFTLPPSVERDLLVRKMFTGGRDRTNVNASASSATGAMLKSIWGMHTEMLERPAEKASDVVASPIEKLPARSLVISPLPRPPHLSGLVSSSTPCGGDQPMAGYAESLQ